MLKQENVSVSWKTALFNIDIKKYLTGCILAFYFWNIFVLLFFKAVPQGTSTKPLTLSTFRNIYSLKMLPQIFPIQCSCSKPVTAAPRHQSCSPHMRHKFSSFKIIFLQSNCEAIPLQSRKVVLYNYFSKLL
jgi:hypothetical protein